MSRRTTWCGTTDTSGAEPRRSAAAVGPGSDCQETLVGASIEDASLPAGWVWRDLQVGSFGWRGLAEWSGGDIRAASLSIACTQDAPTLLRRRQDVRTAFGFEALMLDSSSVDHASAWRSGPLEAASLDWASGDVVGTVIGQHNVRLDELEAIAASIDELLP